MEVGEGDKRERQCHWTRSYGTWVRRSPAATEITFAVPVMVMTCLLVYWWHNGLRKANDTRQRSPRGLTTGQQDKFPSLWVLPSERRRGWAPSELGRVFIQLQMKTGGVRTTQARENPGEWLWWGCAQGNLGVLLRAGLSKEQGLQSSDPARLVWVGGMRRGLGGSQSVMGDRGPRWRGKAGSLESLGPLAWFHLLQRLPTWDTVPFFPVGWVSPSESRAVSRCRAPLPTCKVLCLLHGCLPTVKKSTELKITESVLEHSD